MAVWYIKKSDEQNTFIRKIKQILNVIEVENKEGKIICKLLLNKQTKDKKINSIAKKLNDELYKNCIENVVLSNEFEDLDTFKKELYAENINILNGKILFKYLILDTIKYIYNNQNKKLEEGQISILVNDNTELNLEKIIDIAKQVKRLNIVTNNIQKFKKIEEYLYNEFGIMIRVSNNKKKDLLKSDIVINLDFPKESLKKYILPNKCIMINVNEEYEVEAKKFCGININYYKIKLPEDYKIEGFKNELVYESFIYNKTIDEVKKMIKRDKIKIDSLIGKNGNINKKEFMELSTWQKANTNVRLRN